MPTCVICNSRFYAQSWSAPAEPCDCGAELTSREVYEMDPDRVRELRRRWHEPSPDQAHFNQDGTLKVAE